MRKRDAKYGRAFEVV